MRRGRTTPLWRSGGLPHDQQRPLPDRYRRSPASELVADPQGEAAGEDRILQGIVQPRQVHAAGLPVRAEDGDDALMSGGKVQPPVPDGGGRHAGTQQTAPGPMLRQPDQRLQVGVGMVQPSAQAAVEQEVPAPSRQSRPDGQHHVRIVLLHRVADDLWPLRDPAQGVEVPYNQRRRQPPALQVGQPAVGGDYQRALWQNDLSRLHGPDHAACLFHVIPPLSCLTFIIEQFPARFNPGFYQFRKIF